MIAYIVIGVIVCFGVIWTMLVHRPEDLDDLEMFMLGFFAAVVGSLWPLAIVLALSYSFVLVANYFVTRSRS